MKSLIKKNYKIFYFFAYIYDITLQFYRKHILTREKIIKRRYKKRLGREVRLNNPVEFNDKVQWLKLNWYDSFATTCADKYKVRDVVEKKAGSKYLNNLLAIYENVNEIDLTKLPKSFVLKGSHGSGYNIVCKDKSKMNWKKEFKKMRRWLRNNYYLRNGEWVYRDIKPRIVCEEFLFDQSQEEGLIDYKFYCFNGKPTYCQVIKERNTGGTIDFFDEEWNHMEFRGLQDLPYSKERIPRPEKFAEMLTIAAKLSEAFPFVRVDLYYVNNKIYFGELTFFPRSGFGQFYPSEWNEKIGRLIELPNKK